MTEQRSDLGFGAAESSCHCGEVRICLARAPAEVTEFNCSICRRDGVLWACYRKDDVASGGD